MPKPVSRAQRDSPWWAHGAAISWTALICLSLLLPGPGAETPGGRFFSALPAGSDKLFHGFLFFFETLFLVRSLRQTRSRLPPLGTAIAAALVLAALTETAQLWVPHRDGDGADWIADALGALACGAWVARPRRQERGVVHEGH